MDRFDRGRKWALLGLPVLAGLLLLALLLGRRLAGPSPSTPGPSPGTAADPAGRTNDLKPHSDLARNGKGAVAGRVLEGTSAESIPAAHLGLQRLGRNVSDAVSGEDGSYELPGLTPAGYELVGTYRGVEFARDRIRVRAGEILRRDFRIGISGALSGRVLRRDDNSPIEGAVVRFDSDRGGAAEAITDAGGRFAVEGLPAGMYALSARARGFLPPRAAHPVTVLLRGREPRAAPDLLLDAGLLLTGRVETDAGVPVAGATVVALVRRGTGQPLLDDPELGDRGPTGPDGRFALTVSHDIRDFALTVSHPRHGPAFAADIRALPGQASVDCGVIRLGAGVGLAGRVVNRRGAPVAEAEIQAFGHIEDAGDIPEVAKFVDMGGGTARSDEQGRFGFANLAQAKYSLQVSREGYVTALTEADLRDGSPKEVQVELADGVRIAGEVVDDRGELVEGAIVSAVALQGEGSASAFTDSAGKFRIAELNEGPHRVEAQAEGHEPEAVEPVATGVENLRLVLKREPVGSVRGRLVARDTGRAPAAARVFLVRAPTDPAEPPDAPVASALGEEESFLVERVRAGAWRLVFCAHGYAPTVHSDVAVRAGEVADVGLVEIGRGHVVRGRVLTPRGKPVPHAHVFVGETDSPWSGLDTILSPQTWTRADGTYELGGLGPGVHFLQFFPSRRKFDDSGGRKIFLDPANAAITIPEGPEGTWPLDVTLPYDHEFGQGEDE